jgi:uncharacterized damage-inducible protein DinB
MNYYSGADLARAFRIVRKNTIQVAQEIPEDKYGFRAAEGTMSVAEVLAHLAASPSWQIAAHRDAKMTFLGFEDFPRLIGEATAYAATLKTKAQIIAALEKDGETLATWFESMSDATLAEIVKFQEPIQPPTKTRFEMLMGIKEHEMHHRAQLMLIERMIGIVPHLTRARQANAAARARA